MLNVKSYLRGLVMGLFVGLACAIASGAVVWAQQEWRYSAQISKMKAAASSDLVKKVSEARDTERNRHAKAIDALNQSRAREAVRARERDAARSELDRVRDASADLSRAAEKSLASCRVAAATYRELFEASATLLVGLAEKADRHADDARTCREAWPVDVPRVADSPPPPQE